MIYYDCFHTRGTAITAEGYVYQNKAEINMSSIYTKLIQEAGRFCDAYASDLIIEIDSVRKAIECYESKDFYFGFRDMGVDHNAFIECRSLNELREYRAIWKLSLAFTEDDYYQYKITASLCQVTYSYGDHEWQKMKEVN